MNALALARPFVRGTLPTIDDEIDSLLQSPWFWPESKPCSVPVDIHETEDGYTLSFDLPGMDRKDVAVEVKDGVVTVSGERKQEETKKKDGYTYREKRFGSFSRSFRLPEHVNESEVSAKLKDGVLEVSLLKVPEAKARRISVE